jgi:chromate reductase
MTPTFRVLLVPGSLRERSTNTAVLRTARSVAPGGVEADLYEGLADLPHFNPDNDVGPLHPAVADLRHRIRRADAVFSTPEYAGALPGSFKNLLDWTIGDAEEGSIYQKPVAWINASARGAVNAHLSLRQVLGYATAVIVEAACREVPITETMLSSDGLVEDPEAIQELVEALTTLAGAGRPRPEVGAQP